MDHDLPGERDTGPADEPHRTAVSSIAEGTRVRARRLTWDAVQANNRLGEPDPELPTYEHLDEWVEGELHRRHVIRSELLPAIDYVNVTVGDEDVDEATIVPIPGHRPARRP